MKTFQELFNGYEYWHGRYDLANHSTRERDGKLEGQAKTVRGAPPAELWEQHLRGEVGLGIIPLRADDLIDFFVIDIDDYEAVRGEKGLELMRKFWNPKFPLHFIRSKSGGMHVFGFLEEPLPAQRYRNTKLKSIAATLGFKNAEIFPKQIARADPKQDSGNWINLPYFGDTRRCIDPTTGEEMTLEQFLAHASSHLITQEMLDNVRDYVEPPAEKLARQKTSGFVDGEGLFGDGPPCLASLATMFADDPAWPQRNDYLLMCGTYAQRKWPDDIEAQCAYIIERNAAMSSPLEAAELESTVLLSLRRKREYRYRCKSNQMSEFCNRKLCWTRRYGVEAPEYAEKKEFNIQQRMTELGLPRIEEVTRIEYKDDPAYDILVDPGVKFRATIDDITDPKLFQKLLIKALSKSYPLTKKDMDLWVTPAINKAKSVEIEDHLEARVLFDKALREYIESRKNEDADQPIETTISIGNVKQLEDGSIIMVIANFQKWLRRQGEKFDNRYIQDQLRNEYNMKKHTLPGAVTIWLSN